MTFRVHSSAQPVDPSTFWWMNNSRVTSNPFLEFDLAQRAYEKSQKRDPLLDDIRFGLAHLSAIGEVVMKPDKYQLMLEMTNFEPDDITIRAVHNGFYVRAAHPKMIDGKKYITHHFYREYVLPHNIRPRGARAWMTSEKILFIEAPKVPFDIDLSCIDTTEIQEVNVEQSDD